MEKKFPQTAVLGNIYLGTNKTLIHNSFYMFDKGGGKINTLRTGDADLRFYITTVQDGRRKYAFLTRGCFPCTIHLIMQYIEPFSDWSC